MSTALAINDGLKRQRLNPEESAPSGRSPGCKPLPTDVWAKIVECLHTPERNSFMQTRQEHLRKTMRLVDLQDLRAQRSNLHNIAVSICLRRPDLDPLAARIRRLIPESLLGTELAPVPRDGLLHPLLTVQKRSLALYGAVHDALIGLEELPDKPYDIDRHINFLPTLLNSLHSWDLIKYLMRRYGPWAFRLAIPELQNDKDCILEAAKYGREALGYVRPDILSNYLRDESFTTKLCEYLALLNEPQLASAALVRWQFERYRTKGPSAASAELINRLAKPVLAQPNLYDDNSLVRRLVSVDRSEVTTLSKVGSRTSDRALAVYSGWYTMAREYQKKNAEVCNRVQLAFRNVKKAPNYLDLLASFAGNRDFNFIFLDYVSWGDLNARFWDCVLKQPFDIARMKYLAGRYKVDEDENYTNFERAINEEAAEIAVRFILYFLHADNPMQQPWLSSLFDRGRFPAGDIPLEVYSLLKDRKHQVAWFLAIIQNQEDDFFNHNERDNLKLCSDIYVLARQLNPDIASPQEAVAFILATVLEGMDTEKADELIRSTWYNPPEYIRLDKLYDLAQYLPGVTPTIPLPMARLVSLPAPPAGLFWAPWT